jgi:hypothetical protein
MTHCRGRNESPGLKPSLCSRIFRGLKTPATSGGVNAISRYENGKTRPPLALVKLLKVLDRHPDLLDEIKVA